MYVHSLPAASAGIGWISDAQCQEQAVLQGLIALKIHKYMHKWTQIYTEDIPKGQHEDSD